MKPNDSVSRKSRCSSCLRRVERSAAGNVKVAEEKGKNRKTRIRESLKVVRSEG